jgi:hypothetical protein
MEPDAGAKGTGIDGEVVQYMDVHEMAECCEEADRMKAKGWTFVPATKPDEIEAQADKTFEFKDTVYHDMEEGVPGSHKGGFKTRDVFVLNGKVKKDGGEVKCKNLNGTYDDTTITFSAASEPENGMPEVSHHHHPDTRPHTRAHTQRWPEMPPGPLACLPLHAGLPHTDTCAWADSCAHIACRCSAT